MNSKKVSLFVSILAVVLFVTITTCNAQDKKIDIKKVPQKVLDAFHNAYPKAVIKGTSIENENGHHYFEIESMEGTQHIDLLITHSGKITEVEKTIPESELPTSVLKALNMKFKNLKINKAEKVTSGSKVTYELSIESNNKKHGVVILPNGKFLKSGSAEKENEKGEKEENDND